MIYDLQYNSFFHLCSGSVQPDCLALPGLHVAGAIRHLIQSAELYKFRRITLCLFPAVHCQIGSWESWGHQEVMNITCASYFCSFCSFGVWASWVDLTVRCIAGWLSSSLWWIGRGGCRLAGGRRWGQPGWRRVWRWTGGFGGRWIGLPGGGKVLWHRQLWIDRNGKRLVRVEEVHHTNHRKGTMWSRTWRWCWEGTTGGTMGGWGGPGPDGEEEGAPQQLPHWVGKCCLFFWVGFVFLGHHQGCKTAPNYEIQASHMRSPVRQVYVTLLSMSLSDEFSVSQVNTRESPRWNTKSLQVRIACCPGSLSDLSCYMCYYMKYVYIFTFILSYSFCKLLCLLKTICCSLNSSYTHIYLYIHIYLWIILFFKICSVYFNILFCFLWLVGIIIMKYLIYLLITYRS